MYSVDDNIHTMNPNSLLMAVKGNKPKRKRKRKRTIIREDRLSSLHDDILVEILSRLPLRLAMTTGCLSRRWCSLWTKVTSIHIDNLKFNSSRYIDTTFDDIITRITSPFIHSLSVDLGDLLHTLQYLEYSAPIFSYYWLRQICDRNVRELKVTNSWIHSRFTLSSFICVTQSLVSIELASTLELSLPDNGDQINLPNLKKLHISMNVVSLEKLIKACPSLQELCFVLCLFGRRSGLTQIKFSHQNLQRLFIKELPSNYRVVINVPKLQYLAIHASKSVAFRFEEEPLMLCEAKIDLTDDNFALTEDEIKSMTKNMFCNATKLTLSMNMPSNVHVLLAILELCPVLDVLTLQIQDTEGMERVAEIPCQVRTWQRVLKKIKIEINFDVDGKTTNSFVQLVEYLLSTSVDLKQFRIKVNWGDTTGYPIREMKLCMIPYHCKVVSAGCEIEFVGRFFKMSRKADEKIWITHDKDDIPIY